MIPDGSMSLSPVRVQAPYDWPVTLGQAKRHLRVDHADDDDLIQIYLDAAARRLDGWDGILGRCLTPQTWRVDLPGFPANDLIRLPLPDVQSIGSVEYLDAGGAAQTMAADGYRAVNDALGGVLMRKPGTSWPATYAAPDAVKVTFVAGYGTSANPMPAAIRAAILLHLGVLYDHRAAVDAGTLAELPLAYETLISPYRKVGL